MPKQRFGEFLVNNNYITDGELEDALKKQENVTKIASKQIGNIIMSLGILNEEQITKALNDHSGGMLNYLPISDINITKVLVDKFPLNRFKDLNVLPLRFDATTNTLELATTLDSNATIELAINNIREIYSRITIRVHRVLEYSYINLHNIIASISDTDNTHMPTIEITAKEKLRQIYRDAIKIKASDIHIFCVSEGVKIQFRVARDLFDYNKVIIPLDMKENIDQAILVQCNLSLSLAKEGQIDAAINDLLEDNKWKSRVNIQKTIRGRSITMRLIPKFDAITGFDALGLTDNPKKYLQDLIKSRSGMILVTGPMGSGKNWTITSMVVTLNDGKKYIVTVEDPVEIPINGVNQVEIDSRTTSFGSFGKSILRQDCDVMYLGEIRDPESLDAAIQGGIEGMLVMSTLHTKSVGEVFSRIDSIDKTAYKTSVAAFTGLINQRLIRKLCPHCKKEINFDGLEPHEKVIMSENLKVMYSKDKPPKYKGKLYKSIGCPMCLDRGYAGATVCMEYLQFNDTLRTKLASCKDSVEAENLIREITLREGTSIEFDGLKRLVDGTVDVKSLISEGVFKIL